MDNNTKLVAQNNFTLPHDVVPLPSKGVFYKNKKSSIKVGYLTAADENILMGGGNDVTTLLLRNKVYEPDLRIEDLLEGDVEAILIFLRNTSFGPEINLKLKDPITGKEFETSVLIDELNIKKTQQPNEDGTFTVKLPKSESTVRLKILTYGELLELNKNLETYPKGVTIPKVTLKLQKQILEVDGTSDLGEISRFVNQMPIMDSKFIKKFLDDNEPRLDLTKTVIAPSGEKLTVSVGFGAEFFRPFF